MSRSILEYLEHILLETDFILRESKKLNYKSFAEDEKLTRAFTRSLEIIGEASKNIPSDIKNDYPDIEWKKMAGMRDVLIHAYFGVDYELVWDVVQQEIPPLKKQIKTIIQDLEE